jgi:hypothetical protein
VAFDYNDSYDGSTDYGYNISAPGSAYPGSTGSEMAYMYYNNLGNLAYCDTAGTCPQTAWGLTNTGPFSNVQLLSYWSATEYAPYANGAWKFIFGFGEQNFTDKAFGNNAWAVRSGDVGTAVPSVSSVPIPAAVWLFGSGLAGLFGLARRRKK